MKYMLIPFNLDRNITATEFVSSEFLYTAVCFINPADVIYINKVHVNQYLSYSYLNI